jgi:tol-pal system protein YbgF
LPLAGENSVEALSEQLSQLHSVVDTLVQQQSQSQNELSLLQQRVLQLEAQNELARSKVGAEAQNDSKISSSPADTIQPVPDSAENAALYAKAYTWITQGEYKKAESTLKAYLLAEPKGQYAADSHYWLGEINMVNAQSDVAAKEFRMVIDSFPSSDKAPAAMRELGEIFLANGDSQHAKQMLEKVVKLYPDTAAAVLAQKTLDTM